MKTIGADITTDADIEAQEVILRTIAVEFPEDTVVAEENPEALSRPTTSGYHWLVDPLDGTVNYNAGSDHFCVAIAIQHEGITEASIVYVPTKDLFYWARRGHGASRGKEIISVSRPQEQRQALVAYATSHHPGETEARRGGQLFSEVITRFRSLRLTGSASLDFCQFAEGRFAGLIKLPGEAWDVVPGVLIASEANGLIERVTLPGSGDRRCVVCGCDANMVTALKDMINNHVGEVQSTGACASDNEEN